MSVDKRLLEILVCPATKAPVKALSADKLQRLNREIAAGALHYVGGGAVDSPLDEGLITDDGKTVYRVSGGIPVMLAEQGIAVSDIDGW